MEAIPGFISNSGFFPPPGLRVCEGQRTSISGHLKKLREPLKLGIITLEPKNGGSRQRKTVGRKEGQGWEWGWGVHDK